MDSEDHHESQSPQRDEKKESPRHSRSPSNNEGQRSRSRSPSERRERPHYEYDDGRNNRNEGNTLYLTSVNRCNSVGTLVISHLVLVRMTYVRNLEN